MNFSYRSDVQVLKKASPVKEMLKRSPCINFFNAYVRIVHTCSTKMKIFSVLDLKYKNLEIEKPLIRNGLSLY